MFLILHFQYVTELKNANINKYTSTILREIPIYAQSNLLINSDTKNM